MGLQLGFLDMTSTSLWFQHSSSEENWAVKNNTVFSSEKYFLEREREKKESILKQVISNST